MRGRRAAFAQAIGVGKTQQLACRQGDIASCTCIHVEHAPSHRFAFSNVCARISDPLCRDPVPEPTAEAETFAAELRNLFRDKVEGIDEGTSAVVYSTTSFSRAFGPGHRA